jgi:hypothetical protein
VYSQDILGRNISVVKCELGDIQLQASKLSLRKMIDDHSEEVEKSAVTAIPINLVVRQFRVIPKPLSIRKK